ncbi:MAG: molecular chaperone HtpG [Spirochaetales bacterium]|nr:molecular chaperone HtpG [Spirochaetales bacterium]
MSKHQFQSEVNQLLHLIIHSLYSHKEIFLRELISNASDALDKLKYLTLTDEQFKSIPFQFKIDVEIPQEESKLIISDTGIGMNQEDLVQNLGTIASSGTKKFVETMSGDMKKDSNLIGQFGVGFYSCFMIADNVEVISRKAGEDKAYKWTSDGKGQYEIEEAERDQNGTTIILHLNDEGKEYTSKWQVESIIKKYSNHIAFPIHLHHFENKGDKDKPKWEKSSEQVNSASALWKRAKSELKDEDYKEFYQNLTGDNDDPLLTIHTQAEGAQEYTTLFFIPKKAPYDLYRADYQNGVKLYIKRVFITEDNKELLPTYLRFVKGIIDSEDLPLNVSREILQQNRILMNIKSTSVKKILGELGKMAAQDKEKYLEFYKEFRRPLKEGLFEDFSNRETLQELVMFKSTTQDSYTSLSDYKTRMKPDQKAIYYITGDNETNLKASPLLEMYRNKNIEVLIMDDEIDEIIIPSIGKYKDIDLKAVNRSDAAKDFETEKDKAAEKEIKGLIKKIKDILKDEVKDVRSSARLSDSPACVVADETDPTINMQHILRAMGQDNAPQAKPILEINPNHEIIKKLNMVSDTAIIEDMSYLLLEQSLLIEGATIKNPAQFSQRMNRFLQLAI